MEAPKPGQKLEGQTNIVPWRRLFERAARAVGVFDILKGDEEIIAKKPVKSDYYLDTGKTTTAVDKGDKATATEDGEEDVPVPVANVRTLAIAEYKMDMDEYEKSQQKVLKARKMINDWVSDNIALELEEELQNPEDPVAVYKYINDTYKVSEAYMRKEILSKVTTLKLSDFEDMAVYFNQHRQYKVDLKKAGYDAYGDDEMATNILSGLTNAYRPFINHYDFDKLKNNEHSHDVKFLYKALLTEEKKIETYYKDKKERENSRKKSNKDVEISNKSTN
ncbi:hypothetical protein FOPE_00854 [Fonsecaea pedrosoi]|nr:hypothetical protein FOPE_00854 [Fonsecaea pedrosoi]